MRGRPMQVVMPGESLRAEGILRNEVPIEALYDEAAADRATFRNLLQREGFESLEAVRDDGAVMSLRIAIEETLKARGLPCTAAVDAQIAALSSKEEAHALLRLALVCADVDALLAGPVAR